MTPETLQQLSTWISFGTLVTLIVLVFRMGKFVSNTEHGITDAKDTAVRSHLRQDKTDLRIDKIEERI